MINHVKKGMTLTLALVLMLAPCAVPKTVYGAAAVDTSKQCTVTFSLENLTDTEGVRDPELTEELPMTVPIHLYKVADVSSYGAYTVVLSGTGAQELQTALSGIGAGTKQTEWTAMAELASALVGVDPEAEVFPDTGMRMETGADGTATFADLDTGLYLAAAESVESEEYRYAFLPYLIALPDNRYQADQEGDDWIYELTGAYAVGLKASMEPRYARLIIEKELLSYNETLGSTSFVFRVDAEKGSFHYSDVVSLSFDQRGTAQTLPILDKIPAGASVTVTEVYTGASYQISGEAVKTIEQITADEDVKVTFTNVYDEDSLKGGSSIVNHFPYTPAPDGSGIWNVEQLKDSSAQGRGI